MFHAGLVKRTAATAALAGVAAATAAGAGAAPALARTSHSRHPGHAARGAALKSAERTLTQTGASGPLSSLFGLIPPTITNIAPTDAQSSSANFADGPLSVSYTASKPAGSLPTQATGTFTAALAPGGTTLMSISGPVTCLNVQGSYVGLFYPITASTPAGINQVIKGVYVTVLMGSSGPEAFSFRPSLTTAASGTTNCAPMPAVIPVLSGTGSASS